MSGLAKHHFSQAGVHFGSKISNSERGVQLMGNFSAGRNFNLNRKYSYNYDTRTSRLQESSAFSERETNNMTDEVKVNNGQTHQERLKECRRALHFDRTDPRNHREKLIAVKTKSGSIIKESCQWILTHPKYKDWQSDGSRSNLLWVSSAGERGKTMTAIYLSQELEEAQSGVKTSQYDISSSIDKISKVRLWTYSVVS
ncbi:hypothetical protein N0V91_008912 [Didymella pomorum]|uniref:Nephrocystin 3-like N-terminal domain-containing protein n=1 Tax=Didymella pomorum TaxID=749634 RepID=A0A9W9D4Z8_9PLEO|nr:hypothetical protein N0V91_008912 [Didymella pomorum]